MYNSKLMIKYAIVEIAGKQYKILPDVETVVSFLGDIKSFECDKVLMKAEGDKLEVGSPYLKEKLNFDVLKNIRGPKIRVAKYKSKANSRRVRGFKSKLSKIKLQASKSEAKKDPKR